MPANCCKNGQAVIEGAARPARQRRGKMRGLSPVHKQDTVPDGGRMSLLDHLSELRKRLFVCVACFLICLSACLSQAEWFTNQMLGPRPALLLRLYCSSGAFHVLYPGGSGGWDRSCRPCHCL